jgi:hypothetical protein
MIQKWIISAAVSFMLRQLAKWQKSIDWAMVKADLKKRVEDLIPGEWMDAEIAAMAMALVDAAAAVLASSEELEKIINLVLANKFPEAWQALKDLILSQWVPSTPAEEKAMLCLKDCELV